MFMLRHLCTLLGLQSESLHAFSSFQDMQLLRLASESFRPESE